MLASKMLYPGDLGLKSGVQSGDGGHEPVDVLGHVGEHVAVVGSRPEVRPVDLARHLGVGFWVVGFRVLSFRENK